jgi:hypothetical protein
MSALNRLQRDIRNIESELAVLRKQEKQLLLITGQENASMSSDGEAPRGGRTNWRAVLDKLPKRFSASDVRGVRGIGDKRSGEIFAAITRWIDSGLVKRKERGVYERA